MSDTWFRFVHYPDLRPAYCNGLPTIAPVVTASAEEADDLLDRCFVDAVAWARAEGLQELVGEPMVVRAAEIYRAEWLRQGKSDHGVLRREQSASSWLMFMCMQFSAD